VRMRSELRFMLTAIIGKRWRCGKTRQGGIAAF